MFSVLYGLIYVSVDTTFCGFWRVLRFLDFCAEQVGDGLTFVSSPDVSFSGWLGSNHQLTNCTCWTKHFWEGYYLNGLVCARCLFVSFWWNTTPRSKSISAQNTPKLPLSLLLILSSWTSIRSLSVLIAPQIGRWSGMLVFFLPHWSRGHWNTFRRNDYVLLLSDRWAG